MFRWTVHKISTYGAAMGRNGASPGRNSSSSSAWGGQTLEDIVRDIERMQQQASELEALIAGAQAHAPTRAEGTDATGAVRITLGPDGLPESVRVDRDWKGVLRPAAVGEAVVQSHAAAAQQRMAAWSAALEEGGWSPSVGEALSSAPEPLPAPPTFPTPRRDLDDVADAVKQAFATVEELARRPALTAARTGSNRDATVTITLSMAGLLSCTVDARWAARQTGTALSRALQQALDAARGSLAQAAAAPDPTQRLDQLFGEVLSHISDPDVARS
jgi:hypothetical protein